MANYATITVRQVAGNTLSADAIAEELMRGQTHAAWGRKAHVIVPALAPKLYDRALQGVRDRCKKVKETVEVLDEREMLVRITERRRYRNVSKRPPKVWTGWLRVVEVDVTPQLVERVTGALAPKFAVKGGLVEP